MPQSKSKITHSASFHSDDESSSERAGQKSKITKRTNLTKVATARDSKRIIPRTGRLTIEVHSVTGRKAGTMELPKEIFGGNINNALMAQAVRVYLANQRLGTASTKTRGEVKGSSRKIYRQKGTGRARHGSIRAPIFVKGGVVFGPRPRDFSLGLPKKMKRAAVISALSAKFKNGEIKVYSGLDKIEPKTKIMAKLIRTTTGTDGRLLLVTSANSKDGLRNLYLAARNVRDLDILPVNMLNTYVILNNKQILFMKEAINLVNK